MSEQIINLLLIMFIILFMYFIMQQFLYNNKTIVYDNDDSDIHSDNNIHYYNYNKIKIPERFSLISESEANKNINDLINLQTYLNTYNNMITDSQLKAAEKNTLISNLMTNKYILSYIDSINKANAVVYKEYVKYKKAENKKIL